MSFQFKLATGSFTFFLANSLHHHYTQQRSFHNFDQKQSQEPVSSISTSLLHAWKAMVLPKLVRASGSDCDINDIASMNAPILFK